jgi:predicted PurR-regulated permease PerM
VIAPLLIRLLRMVSLAVCLVAIAWFVGFAVEQSKSASAHQQAELNESAPASQRTFTTPTAASESAKGKPGELRSTIDEIFSAVSSPFSGLTSSLSGVWPQHIVNALLVLLLYGFGFGLIARFLRMNA